MRPALPPEARRHRGLLGGTRAAIAALGGVALCLSAGMLFLGAVSIGCASRKATHHDGRPLLTLERAQALVTDFEAALVPAGVRLPPPANDDDVLAILKSDRLDAFPAAVEALRDRQDIDGVALRAQILLAWAEAELVVSELLARSAAELGERFAMSGSRDVQLASKMRHLREVDEALRLLAVEHVGLGHRAAEEVAQKAPDSYVGYRIAADAARMRNRWPRFAEYWQLAADRNPDSNGLRFLRGAAAWSRDGDLVAAQIALREALAVDPHFVRAQAHLVMVAPDVESQHAELLALTAIAPDHQVVRWAGPSIIEAYEAPRKRAPATRASPTTTTPTTNGSPDARVDR